MSHINKGQVRAQIRSLRGEVMDLAVPENCTVGQLRNFLMMNFKYPPSTVFTFNGGPVSEDRFVEEFPYGSLLVTDSANPSRGDASVKSNELSSSRLSSHAGGESTSLPRHSGKNNRNGRLSTRQEAHSLRSRSHRVSLSDSALGNSEVLESRGEQSTPHRTKGANYVNVTHTAAGGSAASTPRGRGAVATVGSTSATPTAHAQSEGAEEEGRASRDPQERNDGECSRLHTQTILVHAICPSLNFRKIPIALDVDATLGDLLLALVAEEPSLVGGKVLYFGKVMTGFDKRLFNFGFRPIATETGEAMPNGVTVWVAAGEYSSVDHVQLLQIEEDVERISKAVVGVDLEVQARKGYYEELMRTLLKTDELQDLDGDWRQRRKSAVKCITDLQDILKVVD